MPWPQLLIGWKLRAAAVIGKGAARRESATRRKVIERRHHTGNFLQPSDRSRVSPRHDLEPRDRRQQAVRIGMERLGKQLVDLRLFDLSAGIHHDYPLRGLGYDPEIVRDQD